ncbi:AMP-binding protein [Luteolibacter pohnpeiensis]|uniref:AMP-binding protein n=1 Tax=Luteolibacter pohnpeiensis TaxID=454153 RepID=A0A934SD22_9BACT|nr:AMP-binding protein [Luteolibacter pohnpeiensis]MBK1883902.1 AMP-binding protein [Luteolibacter pohnpeiensis]
MLYFRWLETCRLHASRPAVYDGAEVVTFGELAKRVEARPHSGSRVIARSGGVGFFVDLISGWRDGSMVIPIEKDAPEPKLNSDPPAETCLVKYTPGASGIPRGIFFNDAQLIADGDRLVREMGLSVEVPNLAVISLAHSYGFSNIVLPLILHGVPVVLAPVPFPRVVEEICANHAALAVPSVPSIWRAWHRAKILKSLPIRLAVSAGAPLSLDLEAQVYETSGIKIRNFYGTSECGAISFDRSELPRVDASDVGRVMAGVSVSIGRDGRLQVQSDAVAIGYDESRRDDLLGAGCYLTRDVGFVDEREILQLVGTVGGAINVAGRKVSPAKVEAALMATGLVRRARVFGIPSADRERNEEISALVEMNDGERLERLKSSLSERLETWELPRHWRAGAELWALGLAELRDAFRFPSA